MTKIITGFSLQDLHSDPKRTNALLIAPPVYDTQYWSQWSQPYGLLRIASLLKEKKYKKIELFDFMEVHENEKVHQHRINPGEEFGNKEELALPHIPHRITKPKDPNILELYRYHFGKTWIEFENWLDDRQYKSDNPPDEIWISAVMTYWWESVRDLIIRLRRRFNNKATILLGGIYPTLAPEHAAKFTQPDIVVVGEIKEANDLWTDLSLYETPPTYAILTPSRGCPNNCAYCAQKTINLGRTKVDFRRPSDVYAEMRNKWEKFGIRDFALYADFLLWDYENYLIPLLDMISQTKDIRFRIYAPEGLDVRYLSQSQKLVDKLKEAHLQKVYLPCESIDDEYIKTLNRRHVTVNQFVKATTMCEKAGFRLRNMDVNAFVLYGLPGEKVDQVVRSIMFVSEIVGSIIPMLFTPVPSTQLYQKFISYIQEKGWDQDLHMLNGKLFPFLEMNEGSVADYIDLQRLMFTLNSHYRDNSFQLFGNTKVSEAFRLNMGNGFEEFINYYKNNSDG
jgi:hypothetical protein